MALTLRPTRCAVMAMDFQYDILAMTPRYREKELLGTVKCILNAACHASATIVYITVSFRDEYADALAHAPLLQAKKARGVMKIGSPGARIYEELTPHVGDIIINKHGVDPFNSTHLANVLWSREVDTLVLRGVWTHFVVEATARTGTDLGYRIIMVTDGCASDTGDHHEFFVSQILPQIGISATTSDVIAALR